MTSYNKTLAKYPTLDKQKIDKKIAAWHQKYPSGERVTHNINGEYFLTEEDMKEILSFLETYDNTASLKETDEDYWKTFEDKYKELCYSLGLKGGNIQVAQFPTYFGAAVEMTVFRTHLTQKDERKKMIYFTNKKKAEDFILGLKNGNISRYKKTIPLKKYSIWATWNLDAPDNVPFEFCNTKAANEVRANMGLDERMMSKELILFVYMIPKTIAVKRPTIADAELYPYFKPASPPTIGHGWTEPWRPRKSTLSYKLGPRPEGIHSSVELSCLKLPIEIRC